MRQRERDKERGRKEYENLEKASVECEKARLFCLPYETVLSKQTRMLFHEYQKRREVRKMLLTYSENLFRIKSRHSNLLCAFTYFFLYTIILTKRH